MQKLKENSTIIIQIVTLMLIGILFYKQYQIEGRLGLRSNKAPRGPREKKVDINMAEYEKAGMVAGNPSSDKYIMLFNSFTCGFCK